MLVGKGISPILLFADSGAHGRGHGNYFSIHSLKHFDAAGTPAGNYYPSFSGLCPLCRGEELRKDKIFGMLFADDDDDVYGLIRCYSPFVQLVRLSFEARGDDPTSTVQHGRELNGVLVPGRCPLQVRSVQSTYGKEE